MANWFKDEIDHIGVTLNTSIETASTKIQEHIDSIGDEVSKQRSLTKQDIESLIDYAAERFGQTLDERIEKAKAETASLVTAKIGEIRQQLTDATTEQKRVAVRNATISVAAAIIIGALSLFYRKMLHGEFDLLTVFKVVLLSLACGHGIWLVSKYVTEFLQSGRTKKNILFAGAQYLGVFRLQGTIGHILLLAVVVILWAILNFWPQLKPLFEQII